MPKILFITSSDLATNPRLVKEIDFALRKNYKVSVVSFYLSGWSEEKSKNIHQNFSSYPDYIHFEIPATHSNKLVWMYWGICEKVARLLFPFFRKSFFINALASSRRSIQILEFLKSGKLGFDFIVSHNLAALYPSYRIASQYQKPFIFDIEDYHVGEVSKVDEQNETARRTFLMKNLLPKAKYITAASELIASYSENLIEGQKEIKVISNGFPENEFVGPIESFEGDKIKLIWFSQNIDKNRGLEELFSALSQLSLSKNKPALEVSLQGRLNPIFEKEIINPAIQKFKDGKIKIKIIEPSTQEELHRSLGGYDAGLALEMAKSDLNRDICLTNKIIAYLQAGIYVLATNTKAQSLLMKKFSEHGIVTSQEPRGIEKGLEYITKNITSIRENKIDRYQNSKNISWEKNEKTLLDLWNNMTHL